MSHLNAETLARLVDSQPDALETAHLAGCDACRAELETMRADRMALGELGDIEPPAHAWDALHERLIDGGLVRNAHRRSPALLRVAAALALFLAGTAAGFTWRGATLPPQVVVAPGQTEAPSDPRANGGTAADAGTDAQDAQLASSDTRTPAHGPADVATAAPERSAAVDIRAADVQGDARVAMHTGETGSDVSAAGAREGEPRADARATEPDAGTTDGEPRITGPLRSDPRFALQPYSARNAQEAATMLRDAEGIYLDALAQYAQLSGELRDMEDPVARLVALESIVLTTREALDRAPADPIINGYHMTAVAQRDATLRQLAARSRDPWF